MRRLWCDWHGKDMCGVWMRNIKVTQHVIDEEIKAPEGAIGLIGQPQVVFWPPPPNTEGSWQGDLFVYCTWEIAGAV